MIAYKIPKSNQKLRIYNQKFQEFSIFILGIRNMEYPNHYFQLKYFYFCIFIFFIFDPKIIIFESKLKFTKIYKMKSLKLLKSKKY